MLIYQRVTEHRTCGICMQWKATTRHVILGHTWMDLKENMPVREATVWSCIDEVQERAREAGGREVGV